MKNVAKIQEYGDRLLEEGEEMCKLNTTYVLACGFF